MNRRSALDVRESRYFCIRVVISIENFWRLRLHQMLPTWELRRGFSVWSLLQPNKSD